MGDERNLSASSLVLVLALAAVVVALGAAASLTARLAATPTGDPAPEPEAPPAGPEVRALFGPLTDGAQLGRFRIVRVDDVARGAIRVRLAGADGAPFVPPFVVEILRRDPATAGGVGNTRGLSLYLANHASGSTPTVEEPGQGVQALARALDAREAAGAPLPSLLTLAERERRFPALTASPR